jgi:hypothetical protein
MKYLKRFNEELKPSTYRSAARKLDKLGHTKRASDLKNWADKRESDDNLKNWKENIEKFKKFGTFKLNIKSDQGELTEDFYLNFVLDRDAFADSFEYIQEDGSYFWFGIIIIPATEEVIKKCEEVLPDPDFNNGGYWGLSYSIKVEISDDMSLKVVSQFLDNYDDSLTGKVSIADRRSANKFRKLIIDIFSDENLDYPSGYNDFDNIWDLLNLYFGANLGLSGDWGWEPEQIADYIKNETTPNHYFKN